MARPTVLAPALLMLLLGPMQARADLSGQWYGAGWSVDDEFFTTPVDLHLTDSGGTGVAVLYVPEIGAFHQSLPMTIDGDVVTIGDPAVLGLDGTVVGETIAGDVWQSSVLLGTWFVTRELAVTPYPGPAPGPDCGDLPPVLCEDGDIFYCSELIPFEPVEGPGYLNYPMPGGETWDDQRYSYLRRDLVYLIKYAAAKVECKTTDWDYGNFAPLGLGDMSQADSGTPGTDVGAPRHPPGTHEDGKDIDTGYYQLYAPDDLLRAVGDHYLGTVDQYHLVDDPYALDPWRTALFIAYLSEHPNLRAVGVDGRIGPILESALDELVTLGWIDAELRSAVPLAYETEDSGLGWYLFHHTHMHISMLPDVIDVPEWTSTSATPRLHDCSPNPFNPRTTIRFSLARAEAVQLSIYDAAGRLVGRPLDGDASPSGLNEVTWTARTPEGAVLASGVYFYSLVVGGHVETRRMTLLK